LIFDFILPSNGYASDSLSSIQLINTGTFQDASTYLTLNLWADITGNGFTADDSEIGQFSFNAGIWTLASLAYPINTSGRRFIVTLDIANAQFEGGTIQLEVSVEGIEYRSGTTGADDENIGNPQPHLIFPSNRITVISVPEQSDTAAPGSSDNVMLAAALYNGYISDTQNLQAIQTNNISHSNAAQEYSDSELGQVSLFFDTNKNRIMDNDSLLATGYFNDGSLRFSGFNIAIPPESLFYFFMVADIPSNAIDSDSLAISISNPSDLTFSQSVNINGDLPVISGGYLIINGSVFSQYEEIELVSRTLSPGDTSVTLFAFRPASNGNLIDTLQSVTVGNIGDADTSDISSLEIWLDINGDDIWQNSDLFVSSFVYSGLTWTANSLEIEVDEQPPTLFLLADISSLASQDIYFQGTIPLNGCQFKSLNDGPLDNPLIGSATFNITNSEIRVSYRPLIQTRSIGQTIEVGLTVENISTEPMDSVYAQVISVNDSTIVVYDSSFSGPATLASGDSVEFLYYYTAIQTGEVYWRFRAMAPLIPDSSSIVRTNTVTLQDSPSDIYIQLISSIPTAVIRGQTNIFPFSMQYAHPDTENTAASLRLDSLQISIKNSNGEPLNADEVFSRMVLSAGYNNMVVLEDIPAQTTVPLVFSSPVIVPPSQQQLYTLLVDIDSQASASDFMLAIDNSSMIQIVDENSLQTVPLDTGVVFPMQTASCRIDDPSQQSVNINGDLPVISGGYLIINGSVFSQYEEIELVSRTLSPGDTSVTLFAFRPASNGNLIDTLQSVTVGNIGDADTSDISSLEIWLDINGDDIWQNSDLFVSSFVYSGLTWTANSLEIEVDEQPPTLFLLADISSLASQDIYFQGTIPLNGCQFKSLNDGPLDNPLIGSATFNITNSEIRVSYRPLIQTRSIGQTIEVGLTVENISTEPMDSVYAQVISVNDSTIVVYDSSFSGPATLASGDSVEFLYYYTAIQTGEVYWRFRAMAPLIPDSSSIVRTNTVTLQDSPSDIYIQLISSIPTAVIRGQTNIFPFSMQYAHPDTENTAASLRLDSLQISIKNSNGEPLNADEVFSRMVLSAGYNNMVVLEDIPAQTTVPLVFSSPVIVPPSQQQLYTLLVDIDSQASASDFMLAIDNSSMIQIVDENSLQTVPLDTGVVFPMQTASCRIDDPSQQSVNINGDLPVISGGYLIINGSVFSQYEEIELVSRIRYKRCHSTKPPVNFTGLDSRVII